MDTILFEVSNEMHVREWFALHAKEFGYSILVSQAAFPDYVLQDGDGKTYRVEVEYESGNFALHRHDPNGCDFILCWRHTLMMPLPVLELVTRKIHKEMAPATYEPFYPRKAIDEVDKGRRNRIRQTIDNMPGAKGRFLAAIAGDLKAQSEFQQGIKEARMALLEETRLLLVALNKSGVSVESMNPYDVLELLSG